MGDVIKFYFFQTQMELHPNVERDRHQYSTGLNVPATVSEAAD